MTTSQDTPLEIAEIPVGLHGGRIGLTFAPGKKQPYSLTGPHDRDLDTDLDVVAAWGAAAVVTLMETHELESREIAGLGTAVRLRHIEWHHAPIVDVSVPGHAFEAAWPALSARLRGLTARGARVLVHCRGGLGRAGMVAARLLVEGGVPADEAIATVRATRPGAVETEAQERWVAAGRPTPLPVPAATHAAARDRALGALVGLAVGDALGTTLEFALKPRHAVLDTIIGGGPFGLRPGQWTDDTAMALALAESLAHDPGLDARDLMDRFVGWYRRGEYSCTGAFFDIGVTTRSALTRYEATGEPVAGSTGATTAGNGALMRLSPVAIRHWRDPETLAAVSDRQTRTTHGAPQAVRCSRQLADLLARAIAGTPLQTLLEGETAAAIEGGWCGLPREAIEGSGYVVRSLQAAVWAVARTGDFRSAVLLAANLGDDADTTAAVAGQLAGAVYGLSGIPQEWLDVLAWRGRIEAAADHLFAAGCPDDPAGQDRSTGDEPAGDESVDEGRRGRFQQAATGFRIFRPGVGEMVFVGGKLIPKTAVASEGNTPTPVSPLQSSASEAACSRATDDLVAYWSRLGNAHVHPDDAALIPAADFALGLHPVPWAGPLRSAKVFVLALNPGLDGDESAEEARPDFAQAVRANLAGDQPYLYLREAHATHPGYRWARRTFGPDITEADAPDLCMLQLVPYHSRARDPAVKVAPKLPSTAAIRRFVHEGVLPRVRAGQAGLVVARSAKLWGVTVEEPGIVVYAGTEPRRAYQTRGTRGGQLLRRLLTRNG